MSSQGFYTWSLTPNNNATADSTVNWSPQMAPSAVSPSARAMMSRLREYGNDIAGAIVTGGTSTAYTVSSNQVFDTLAHLAGQIIAFTPNVTNGAGPITLNVDGLGAKPLRSAPNADLQAGVLIQGTPYLATYNNSDGAFYLQGFFGNPYNVPLGASLEYWLPAAPNSSFAFPYGQAISRTTYATLFANVGTTYGAGDGSTTFNLPDVRGRVVGCPDNMGGVSDAGRLADPHCALSGVRTTLGGSGGEGAHTLAAGEIPTITANGSATGITVSGSFPGQVPYATGGGSIGNFSSPGGSSPVPDTNTTWAGLNSLTSTGSGSANVTSNNTGGQSHNVAQPTILANRIMRII